MKTSPTFGFTAVLLSAVATGTVAAQQQPNDSTGKPTGAATPAADSGAKKEPQKFTLYRPAWP